MCKTQSPRAAGGKEGSSAHLGHLGQCACSQPPHHKATDAQRMGVWECDLALHGGWADSVTELLNRATSALNFEPGSAGTEHGGWGRVALTAAKRMFAIPLPPKWRTWPGKQPRNWKATAHPHSHEFVQLGRKSGIQARQDSGAQGFVPGRKASPPAKNLDGAQTQSAFLEPGLLSL